MSTILIGGTPGTGKTEVSQILGAKIEREIISLGDVAKEKGCIEEYDDERGTNIIDEDCLVDSIIQLLEDQSSNLIIEGHYIDLIPKESVELVVILRTHPKILRERLTKRDYAAGKLRENVEAEVIGVCQMDAINSFGEKFVIEIDTTELTPEKAVEKILSQIDTPDTSYRIDWMSILEEKGVLSEYLEE